MTGEGDVLAAESQDNPELWNLPGRKWGGSRGSRVQGSEPAAGAKQQRLGIFGASQSNRLLRRRASKVGLARPTNTWGLVVRLFCLALRCEKHPGVKKHAEACFRCC